MLMIKIVITLVALAAATTAQAFSIGEFPGLDALIEKADAIVVLDIRKHIVDTPGQATLSTYDCLIYHSLKGDIPPGSQIPLELMDPRTPFTTPFIQYSAHLVFLVRISDSDKGAGYRTLGFEGASLRLSPFGNETAPAGVATRDKIGFLLRTSIAYWSQQQKKEQEFIEMILSERKEDRDASLGNSEK